MSAAGGRLGVAALLVCVLARPVHPTAPVPVLVPDFVAERTVEIPDAGAIAARWMRDALRQASPQVVIVPEHHWLPRIAATGVQINDPLSPSTAAALHDISGARFLVQGRLVQWGDRHAIEVRIFALPSGEWRHTGKVWVESINEVPDAVARLSAALFGTSDVPGEFQLTDRTAAAPDNVAEPAPAAPPPPPPNPRSETILSPPPEPVVEVTPEPAVADAVAYRPRPAPVYAPLSPHLVRALVEERFPDMVYVPGGTFVMGADSRDALDLGSADPARQLPAAARAALLATERPAHEVSVAPFLIDRYEVTNAEYAKFRVGHTWPPGADDHPVTNVSWPDAVAYARSVGKRLPTEAEWEKAARGTDGRRWPWGNAWDPAAAGLGAAPAPVDSVPASASFYGVEGLSGNVQEWTASLFAPYPGNSTGNPLYDGRHRVVRGSHWAGNPFLTRTTARFCALPGLRGVRPAEANYAFIGFRCARDVPPLPTLYKWLEESQVE